jgi:hypothetical protein
MSVEAFEQTREDLIAQFGALSLLPDSVRGVWVHEGARYEDELLRLVVDVEDTSENQQFFLDFKPTLLQRFEQIEIYIASYAVDIV